MLVWFDTTPRGGGVPSGVDQLRALGEPVGVGAGLDDGAAEGESVDDGGASLGSVKVLVQPEKDSLHAIATELSPRARSEPQRAARRRSGPAACTQVRRCTAERPVRSARWSSTASSRRRPRPVRWPSLVASVHLTRKPDIAASVPSAIRRWDLPVPESPIKHRGWPFLTHSHLARVWTTAGSMLGLPSKSKPRRDFSRGTWRP
jgi:hypothetical protein